MEENWMRNNSYPDEPQPVYTQTTDRIRPLPDLPMKQVPQTPPATDSATQIDEDGSDEELQQEPGQILKFAMGKINDFLQWFLITLEITLAVRFLLRLIGADPTNIFAAFIYALTSVILFPFSNIVRDPSFRPPNEAFELSTLIGMGVYFLIFWLLRWLVRITISDPKPDE
jgi:hypothetical protein